MIITWLFDKLGYMPKISVDAVWSFPAPQKNHKPVDKPPVARKKPAAKKTVAKRPAVKKAK